MNKILLSLELEGLPPTLNHMYRSTASGRRYKTVAGKEYQQLVSNAIMEKWSSRSTYTGAVGLRVLFETATRRRWDIDNRIKALQDCFSMAGVIADDRQIDELYVRRVYGRRDMTKMELRGL